MEVHHHSHSARKKWTHYFWEFLMLFLAVFCGFLAEYQLEHKIEKDRGKQYILSFYEDLKSDTGRFSSTIRHYENKAEAFKKMDLCFQQLTSSNNVDTCILNLFRYSEVFEDFVYTDGTLQQLKNAGGFRLLQKEDVDSILSYDNLLRLFVKGETSGFQDRQNRLREIIYSMMSYQVSGKRDTSSVRVLLNVDSEKVNRYFVTLNAYANACKRQEGHLREIKAKAITVLIYLKEKYNLK